MVSFVCDFCQQTLKKAKLEQHTYSCKRASFSCIDCAVSFTGTSYKAHTSCITEVQKFQKTSYQKPVEIKAVEVVEVVEVKEKKEKRVAVEEVEVPAAETKKAEKKSKKQKVEAVEVAPTETALVEQAESEAASDDASSPKKRKTRTKKPKKESVAEVQDKCKTECTPEQLLAVVHASIAELTTASSAVTLENVKKAAVKALYKLQKSDGKRGIGAKFDGLKVSIDKSGSIVLSL